MFPAVICRRSSVVERALGKGEVGCSIHPGGTTYPAENLIFFGSSRIGKNRSEPEQTRKECCKNAGTFSSCSFIFDSQEEADDGFLPRCAGYGKDNRLLIKRLYAALSGSESHTTYSYIFKRG